MHCTFHFISLRLISLRFVQFFFHGVESDKNFIYFAGKVMRCSLFSVEYKLNIPTHLQTLALTRAQMKEKCRNTVTSICEMHFKFNNSFVRSICIHLMQHCRAVGWFSPAISRSLSLFYCAIIIFIQFACSDSCCCCCSFI